MNVKSYHKNLVVSKKICIFASRNKKTTNMIFGMTPFGTTWIIIGIILGVILLFLLGIFYDERTDGDGLIMLKAGTVILVCVLWPFAILIAVCIGLVAIPIYLGKEIRSFIAQRKEKKIEKEKFFKQLEELNKKGG